MDKNDNKVIQFAKPAIQPKPANDETPPTPHEITFVFTEGASIVKTGFLIFMAPFIGVGQQDGSVGFLANPGELLHVTMEEITA